MKSLISTVLIIFLTLTINAQSVSFNNLKEAALGEEDVLKRELIENGWTMEKMDDEVSYGYVSKDEEGQNVAYIIFSDSYISCGYIELSKRYIFSELYDDIKSKCRYNGVEAFGSVPVEYLSYTHKSGVNFRVYSQDGVYHIDADGSSIN